MGKGQRTKGAVGEREVRDIFRAALNRDDLQRNITQSRDGGYDLAVGPLVVEVKRRKSIKTMHDWMGQAIAAAKPKCDCARHEHQVCDRCAGLHIPTVVFRQDGDTSWMVMLRLNDFLKLTRDELMAYLEEGK